MSSTHFAEEAKSENNNTQPEPTAFFNDFTSTSEPDSDSTTYSEFQIPRDLYSKLLEIIPSSSKIGLNSCTRIAPSTVIIDLCVDTKDITIRKEVENTKQKIMELFSCSNYSVSFKETSQNQFSYAICSNEIKGHGRITLLFGAPKPSVFASCAHCCVDISQNDSALQKRDYSSVNYGFCDRLSGPHDYCPPFGKFLWANVTKDAEVGLARFSLENLAPFTQAQLSSFQPKSVPKTIEASKKLIKEILTEQKGLDLTLFSSSVRPLDIQSVSCCSDLHVVFGPQNRKYTFNFSLVLEFKNRNSLLKGDSGTLVFYKNQGIGVYFACKANTSFGYVVPLESFIKAIHTFPQERRPPFYEKVFWLPAPMPMVWKSDQEADHFIQSLSSTVSNSSS